MIFFFFQGFCWVSAGIGSTSSHKTLYVHKSWADIYMNLHAHNPTMGFMSLGELQFLADAETESHLLEFNCLKHLKR